MLVVKSFFSNMWHKVEKIDEDYVYYIYQNREMENQTGMINIGSAILKYNNGATFNIKIEKEQEDS